MIQYNMSRAHIEEAGRAGAHIVEETDSTRRVTVLNDFDLFVLKDDISLAPHLTNDGFWEAWIASWLTRWLRPGMTFIDIGANCGFYTMLADKLVGKYGNVISYEPNPVYAELLRATRNVNDSTFKIREMALSDSAGKATLTVPDNYHGSASIMTDFKGFDTKKTYDVTQGTLDSELLNLTFFRHDIIKMDAEGAEEAIWNGGSRIWDANDHTTVMLEYTPNSYSDGFVDQLFEWGDVSAIDHSGGEFKVNKEWIGSLTDWWMLVVRKR